MRYFVAFLFLITAKLIQAQMVISSGTDVVAASGTTMTTTSTIENQSLKTDFSKLKLVLAATGTAFQGLVNSTVRPLSVDAITLNTNATFAVAGEWLVLNDLTFIKGKLASEKKRLIPAKLGYSGTKTLVGNDDSYINGRIFILSTLPSSQPHTFPIGTNAGYFPAQLTITTADAINGVGMEVVTENPGFATSVGDIKEIFTDHFWEITAGTTGTLTKPGLAALSKNGTDLFFTGNGDAIVLEMSSANAQDNLGGEVVDPFYKSTKSMSATAKTLALAKSDVISVKIHKLITPGEDEKNDVLFIEGIDSFPENEVLLIDRWGKEVASWKSFENYPQPATSAQTNFDFNKLDIGNYVCVVKYVRKGKEEILKQFIVVLK